jgi:hypothetical protein
MHICVHAMLYAYMCTCYLRSGARVECRCMHICVHTIYRCIRTFHICIHNGMHICIHILCTEELKWAIVVYMYTRYVSNGMYAHVVYRWIVVCMQAHVVYTHCVRVVHAAYMHVQVGSSVYLSLSLYLSTFMGTSSISKCL